MFDALCFAVEAKPDVAGLRKVYGLDPALSDSDITDYAYQRSRALNARDSLSPHMLSVVAISVVAHDGLGWQIHSFCDDDETCLLQGFFSLVASAPGELICWEEGATSLVMLRGRALINSMASIPVAVCGEIGAGGRYVGLQGHYMSADVAAGLNEFAALLNLPRAQRPKCDAGQFLAAAETRAVTTALVALRHGQLIGALNHAQRVDLECELRQTVVGLDAKYWTGFLSEWPVCAENQRSV